MRIGGFGNEIRGRAARGDEGFSNAVETSRNLETIRGRCMMVEKVVVVVVVGGEVGFFSGCVVQEGNQLPFLDGPQPATHRRGLAAQWLSSTSSSSRSLLPPCLFS